MSKKETAAVETKPAKIEQNGVTRPNAGTSTGRVWEIADELATANGAPVSRGPVLEKATTEGLNKSTVSTQYGKWCKFHGISSATLDGAPRGRKPKAKAEAAPAEATPA